MKQTLLIIGILWLIGFEPLAHGQSYLGNAKCKEFEKKISDDIKQSASCQKVEDCKSIWLGCPFGCGTALRASEEARIRKQVDDFNSQCPVCKYQCMAKRQELKCTNSHCVLEYEENSPTSK